MIDFRAFPAFRPTSDTVAKVAALPYDVMNSDEAREMVKDNPLSFLHVDKAEIDLPVTLSHYDPAVYQKAKENLENMIATGVYVQDEKPSYYIYELTMNGRAQAGIVGVSSIDDYIENRIKKHEFTREEKELDRIQHVDTCNAQTGPIFLTYRDTAGIQVILKQYMQANSPVYNFTAEDGVMHRIWHLNDAALNEEIQQKFAQIPATYIADGHHRTASAVKVGLKRRESADTVQPDAAYNYFLSVLFPHDELYIMDYNRILKDTNGHTAESLLSALQTAFTVEKAPFSPYRPEEKGMYGMYIKDTWYKLTLKNEFQSDDVIQGLDVTGLQTHVLEKIFGIEDVRKDARIDFVGGIRGLGELEKLVQSGEAKVAFSMYPTTMNELLNVADANEIMPPKSTWFEPKLRSGIFIHKL